MDKLVDTLMPFASKVGNNKCLVAIRDGITLSIPLLLIGSLFMVIAALPFPGWEAWLGEMGITDYLWKGVSSSFGLIGLVSSFGIAYSFARQYKVDGIAAGIVSLSAFITVTPFVEGGLPESFMGAQGLFVAILLALISGYVYQWCIHHNIHIKMPEAVPPAVSRSFSAIIPGAIVITSSLFIYGLLDSLSLPNLHEIARVVLGGPLGLLGDNVIGFAIVTILNSLFWFVGLHGGNVVNAVIKPIWIANLDANRLAHAAGEELPHIFTSVFADHFVFLGGGGATLGLVIALFYLSRKKQASQQAKALAPITLTPGLFNINEPTMFGLPIVLNPMLLLPFVLAPLANLLIAWISMAVGLVPLTYIDPGWTMPPIISGFLATNSVMGSLLQFVLVIVDICIYLPFIIAIEKGFQKQEQSGK